MAADSTEGGLPKNPNLDCAQWFFMLKQEEFKENNEIKSKLENAIITDSMAPFYEYVAKELNWTTKEDVLTQMKTRNQDTLKELDAAIEDAEKNFGEMEVREANLKKAEFLCKIGDKEATITAFRKAYDKTVSLGHRLDIVFNLIRFGLFYMDHDLITRNVDKAKTLIEEGGDWDRRNRLKVYQGLYAMAIRDFTTAANLFLDAVSTFTSYELMSYEDFVVYTVIVSVAALPRNDLRSKVVKGSEILEVLYKRQDIKDYLFSFYNCQYGAFFRSLSNVERILKYDRILSAHYRYYVREMRILAYSQLLESYRSLTLQYMADSFGVTPEFIDRELSRFIANGRINCKIDKVGGIVETNRPDSKNYQYQAIIKQGDILLNRIQKLSRVINI